MIWIRDDDCYFCAKIRFMQILPKSLQYIVDELSQDSNLKPSNVVNVVKKAEVKVEDLEEWSDFDHPSKDSYGRKMVHKAPNFEVMVMSWLPGDFSAIHDHGYTTWGAVQVFGQNEHATFRVEDNNIYTLNRTTFETNQIVGVGHNLVHQMGNSTDEKIMTLHVYGVENSAENITGDARLYDLASNSIQIINGGVFFDLPEGEVDEVIEGPSGDFPTKLRHMVELGNRINRSTSGDRRVNDIKMEISSDEYLKSFHSYLDTIINSEKLTHDTAQWNVLNMEMKATAKFLQQQSDETDSFHKYAEMYDALICQPCFDSFMKGYFEYFVQQYCQDIADKTIISLGCGTGLVEEQMMNQFDIPNENIYGIDFSDAMVEEARMRIKADQGDVLTLDPQIRTWDIAFSGLNVYQYLDSSRLEEAIQRTAAIVKDGGFFIGDFITPDHIRWYPNVMKSPDKQILSLRTPRLKEVNGKMFQESEIINVDYSHDELVVNYAGKHKRFLVPIHRVRAYFEKYFNGEVMLLDALSLEIIPEDADTCPSTRYVVVAKK